MVSISILLMLLSILRMNNMAMKKILILYFLAYLAMFFNTTDSYAQSPYNKSCTKDGLIFGSGIGFIITSEILNSNIDTLTIFEINQLSKNDINWFDRSAASNYSPALSSVSGWIVGACIISPLTLFLSKDIRDDACTMTTMYLETLLLSTFVPRTLKSSGRIRPLIYNPDVPLEKKLELKKKARASFPSGHTTSAFATAVFFATVYSNYFPSFEWKPYIWSGALLTASSVGYLRYASGKHFPTDVLASAVIGSAIGYFIPYLHKRKSSNNLSIQPICQMEQFQIAVQFTF